MYGIGYAIIRRELRGFARVERLLGKPEAFLVDGVLRQTSLFDDATMQVIRRIDERGPRNDIEIVIGDEDEVAHHGNACVKEVFKCSVALDDTGEITFP